VGVRVTKLYQPIIDSKPVTMISLSGLSIEEVEAYCIDKFCKDRFGGFLGE
jgi:hypothetical protein